MKQMALNVKVHESYIKKVSRGLKARIQVDAFPEEKLTGEVIKVGVLPDSQNRYMSPDLKVYADDDQHQWRARMGEARNEREGGNSGERIARCRSHPIASDLADERKTILLRGRWRECGSAQS